MKNILLILLAAISVSVSAQVQMPAASSAGSISSKVGLTDINIDYSRPKAKGRKIFGEGADFLIPFGKIWRTGANGGTKITFSDDVKVEGNAVAAGSYLIFSWPGAAEWKVSLYKDLTIGGNTDGYDATKEVTSFKVKPEAAAPKVETFTMAIGDISEDNTTAKVQIAWENTSVKFTVIAEYDSKVNEAIESSSLTAARYFHENKKDSKKAIKWMDEYFASGTHENEFWNYYLKAQMQKSAGDKAGSLATAQKSLALAKAAKDGDFGYIKRNEDLIKSLSAK